ncbi:hypothetical protein G6L37_05655 [Agrobacterium rubi]|nr:hypothetical protein [Agrobacterium rubi]NTF24844.1 hypothetical protein [Agrobacterium rubi]
MIRQHRKSGATRATFADTVGRICMYSDMTDWNGGCKPFRVVSEDGRAVIGHELKRIWVQSEHAYRYFDEHDTKRDIRVEKSAIRFSCDTAAEALSIMEVSRVAHEDMIRARNIATERLKSLIGKEIQSASAVVLLCLDDRDDWVDPDTGNVLLSIPRAED